MYLMSPIYHTSQSPKTMMHLQYGALKYFYLSERKAGILEEEIDL